MLDEQSLQSATTSQQKPDDELKPIKTFQSDVEELLRKQQISKATIAISESEKRVRIEEQAPQNISSPSFSDSKIFKISGDIPLSSKWNIGLITLAVIGVLVIGGISAGVFFYFRGNGKQEISEPNTTIPQGVAIAIDSMESKEGAIKTIWSQVRGLSVPQNELRVIPIKLDNVAITTLELFEKIEASAPAPLERALGTMPTLGIHGFRGGKPFLLFSVSSYDHAFDGMLSWEQNLLSDIGPLFGISVRDILGKAASTTSEALQNTLAVKDVIIKNKDVRAIFDPKKEIIFLYSFIDKETLVLTTSEDTLRFLIGKAWGGRLR